MRERERKEKPKKKSIELVVKRFVGNITQKDTNDSFIILMIQNSECKCTILNVNMCMTKYKNGHELKLNFKEEISILWYGVTVKVVILQGF